MDFKELENVKCTYERVNRRIEKTVKQVLLSPASPNPLCRLEQNEQILGLIETMFTWIMQLDRQFVAQVGLCAALQVPQGTVNQMH